MVDTTNASQLIDAITLLSKVSDKLNTKANDAVLKMSGQAEQYKDAKDKKSNTPDRSLLSAVESIFSRKEKKEEKKIDKVERSTEVKKPKETVETAKPITIIGFGKHAIDQLHASLVNKDAKPTTAAPIKEEGGFMKFIKGLIGPALLLFGGIAAFITGLMSDGPLKGVFTMIGKIGIKGGLLWMAKKLGKFLGTKVLRKIPIIGTILAFMDAWTRFQDNDYVGGTIAILSGLVSLIDLVAPGVGSTLSIGLDVLNSVLDLAATGKTPKERNAQKLRILDQWAGKITEMLLKIPFISNFAKMGQGIGDIIAGRYKEGLLNMAYTLPFFGTFLGMMGLPKNKEEASEDISSIADKMNKAMQPVYKAIIGILPSWMSDLITIDNKGNMTFTPGKMFDTIAKRVTTMMGIVDNTKGDKDTISADRAAAAAFKKEHDKVMEQLKSPDLSDDKKKELLAKKKETESKYGKYNASAQGVEQHDDFIMTPGGKVIEPHKDDTVIGFKPGSNIDKILGKSSEGISTSNDLIKKLTESTNKLMAKQIEILMDSKKTLQDIAEKINSAPASNVVSSRSTVNNIFQQTSIRDLQRSYT